MYKVEIAFKLLFEMLKDKGIKFTEDELKSFYNETTFDVDNISERMSNSEKSYDVLKKEDNS
jgi:hypothetical protein